MSELLYRLGKSKAEKMQENFLTVEKAQAMEIIRKCGGDCFALWFYLEGKCYGSEKVFSFPSKKTISNEFGKSESTVERWLSKLSECGALKLVSSFTPNGQQTSNVYIMNAEFPDVPEGWSNLFPEGVVLTNGQITDRRSFLGSEFGAKIGGGSNLGPSSKMDPPQNWAPNNNKSLDSFKNKKDDDDCAANAAVISKVFEIYQGQIQERDFNRVVARVNELIPAHVIAQGNFESYLVRAIETEISSMQVAASRQRTKRLPRSEARRSVGNNSNKKPIIPVASSRSTGTPLTPEELEEIRHLARRVQGEN